MQNAELRNCVAIVEYNPLVFADKMEFVDEAQSAKWRACDAIIMPLSSEGAKESVIESERQIIIYRDDVKLK